MIDLGLTPKISRYLNIPLMLAALHHHRVVSIRRQGLVEGRDEKSLNGVISVLNQQSFVLRERQIPDQAPLSQPETSISLTFVVKDHEIAGVWTFWGWQ